MNALALITGIIALVVSALSWRTGPSRLCWSGLEHGLDHGVVVAVTTPTDRRNESGGGNETAVVIAAVLAAAVGVVDQAGRRSSKCNRTLQRRHCQAPFHPVTHGPADDSARDQIDDDDGQIQPALRRPHVRDVMLEACVPHDAHLSFGASVAKFCSRTFGATGPP